MPSIKPAFSSNISSCTSPNRPRVCELERAPANFVACSRRFWLPTCIDSIWVLIADSAAARLVSASAVWVESEFIRVLTSEIASLSAALVVFCEFMVAICCVKFSTSAFAPASSAAMPAEAESPCAWSALFLRLAMKKPRAKPMAKPVKRTTTDADMGLSWQEALTYSRRLYSSWAFQLESSVCQMWESRPFLMPSPKTTF